MQVHCWQGGKWLQPQWKISRNLKKLQIELPYDPAISLLGIQLKKSKALIRKDIRVPKSIAPLCTIGKVGKQPKCLSEGVHIYSGKYYSAIKTNEILPFMTAWMDLQGIMLSELSQTEEDIPYDCSYTWI